MHSMILCTLIFLTNIVNMRLQPATCNDDVHCSVGFFCHTMTHSCHECLSCDHLRRRQGPDEYDCIKSDRQCGPCLEGFINDEAWGAICLSPEAKTMKTSYVYIFVSCVAAGVLISLFIVHNIWNTPWTNKLPWKTHIKVNIACKKILSPTADSDEFFTKKNPKALTA